MVPKVRHLEIAGKDGARLKEFYGALFGWKIRRREVAGSDYYDVDLDGGPTLGIRHEPDGEAELVAYYEVEDLSSSVETAVGLGAVVRIRPMEYEGLVFALLEDPEGNPVGLLQK